jgi:hypothetical protein
MDIDRRHGDRFVRRVTCGGLEERCLSAPMRFPAAFQDDEWAFLFQRKVPSIEDVEIDVPDVAFVGLRVMIGACQVRKN